MKNKNLNTLMWSAIICLATLENAGAGAVYYTFSGIGSGSLDGSAFSDASFTISAVGNGVVIESSLAASTTVESATVSVDGLSPDTFAASMVLECARQPANGAGVDLYLGSPFNTFVIGITNSSFFFYDLAAPFGPVSGAPGVNAGSSIPTTLGNFSLTSVSSETFQASVSPVPEPSSLSLAGLGCAGLAGWLARKSRV
jgi:hypothetical protein